MKVGKQVSYIFISVLIAWGCGISQLAAETKNVRVCAPLRALKALGLSELSLVQRSCRCQSYSISTACNSENGEVTFAITNTDSTDRSCNDFSPWMSIGSNTESKGSILESRLRLQRGATTSVTVASGNKPLTVALGYSKKNLKTLFRESVTCGAATSPASLRAAQPGSTEYPGGLTCTIEAAETAECTGAITSVAFYGNYDYQCDYYYGNEAAVLRDSKANTKREYYDPCYQGEPGISFDPYVQYKWSYECLDSDNASVSGSQDNDSTFLEIDLTSPGQGKPTVCEVELEVTLGEETATCTAITNVAPCILDCNGEINGQAIFDACGVCGGNGTSCGQSACDSENIVPSQILVDGSARTLAHLVEKSANLLLRVTKNQKRANMVIELANQARLQTWSNAWSLPNTVFTCDQSNVLCTKVSLRSVIGEIFALGLDLKRLGEFTNRAIIRQTKSKAYKRRAKDLRRKIRFIYSRLVKELDSLPGNHSVCQS